MDTSHFEEPPAHCYCGAREEVAEHETATGRLLGAYCLEHDPYTKVT